MIITTNLTDGTTVTKSSIEIEQDSVSISFNNNIGINIIFNDGRITAYAYTSIAPDPEVITLSK